MFTGLFSAAVATLISVTIQDIRPDPQETSNFYLASIYQTITDSNRSNISSSPLATPPKFSPPNYAVWVNALWFLSLVISLTCALLATLIQQWARRYLNVTQSRYSPYKRARIHAFFSKGVEKFLLPKAVDILPALLHISLFLFFAGLVVFLFSVNMTISKLVLSWVGVCTALYGFITLMPIIRHDSPYYTSFSSLVWPIVIGIQYFVSEVWLWYYLSVRRRQPGQVSATSRSHFYRLLLQGMQKTAEETALNSPSKIDTRTFMWTLDSLDEDHELERFFSGLPDFRSSKVVKDPLPDLTEDQKQKLSEALTGLLDRTFSSDLLSAAVKKQRAMICAKAADPAYFPMTFDDLDRILSNFQYSVPLATEILQIVRGWGNNWGGNTLLVAQATVTIVIARAQRDDNAWFVLASKELAKELDVSESVLQDYAEHGDSLSLAILIYITRMQYNHFREHFPVQSRFEEVLEAASEFNVQDTSPELQHKFCTLWNEIVLKAQNDYDRATALWLLRPIRNVYVALHQGTNSAPTRFSSSTGRLDDILMEPSSYPVCNVTRHIHGDSASTVLQHNAALVPPSPSIPDPLSLSVPAPRHIDENPTPRIHDVSVSTSLTNTVPLHNAALAPTPLASLDLLSSSVPTPLHVDENPMDVPLPDNYMSVSSLFHPAHQTAMENLPIPATSPDPATAGGTRDIDTSTRTMSLATPETSASPPSIPSTGPIAPQENTDLLAHSDAPDIPSSASLELVLGNIPLTGSHCSILGTTSPGTSPGPNLALGPGTVPKSEGDPKTGSPKHKDAPGPPSANRAIHADTIATSDPPPHFLPPPSVADIPIMGLSSDAENTGGHFHASHGQCDIV